MPNTNLEKWLEKYGSKGNTKKTNKNKKEEQRETSASYSNNSTPKSSVLGKLEVPYSTSDNNTKIPNTTTEKPTITTPKPTDYSSAVKYLQDRGVQNASGIMTEHEWGARNRNGGTYQDYLDEVISFSQPMELSVNVDGTTKSFGTISRGAYKAIEENALDKYVIKNDEEKKALAEYTKFAEEYAKKQRNPENFWQGLLHTVGYSAEKIGAGAVDAISDAGKFVFSAAAQLASIPAWGSWDEALKKNAAYIINDNTLGDLWDVSAETRYRVPDWYRNNFGGTLTNVGATLPAIAAEVYSGGTSTSGDMLLANVMSGTNTSANIATKTISKNLAKKLVKPKSSDAMFFLSAAGSSADAGYELSGNTGKALNYGVLNGLGEVATEKIFSNGYAGTGIGADDALIDIFKIKGINKIANNKYGKKALDIGLEGVEEVFMADADPWFQKMTVNPDAEISNPTETQFWKERGESFSQGVLLSVFSNAITVPTTKAIDTANKGIAIHKLNKSAETLNATLPSEAYKIQSLRFNASIDEINAKSNEIQKAKAIKVVNMASEGINAILKDEADKLELLQYDSSIEEIKERQKQIKVFADAYVGLLEQEVVNSNPELFPERQVAQSDSLEQAARDVVANNEKKVNAAREAGSKGVPRTILNLTTAEEVKAYNEGQKAANKGTPSYEALETLSQNNEPITAEDVKKVTVFGDKGAELVAELANKEGATLSQAERMVKTAYMAGLANLASDKVSFVTDEQIDAFTAGKKDRVMKDLSANEKAKNATVKDAQKYNIIISNLKRKATELGILDKEFFVKLQNIDVHNLTAADKASISSEFHRVFAGNTDPLVASWLDSINVDITVNAGGESMAETDNISFNSDMSDNKTMYEIMDELGLTYEEQDAIVKYKSSESYVINFDLLHNNTLSDEQIAFVKMLNRALDKFPVYKGAVYRNIGFATKEEFEQFVSKYGNSEAIKHEAFTSASKTSDAYEVDLPYIVHYEILSHNGKDVSSVGLAEENEVLFKTDTEFAVKSFEVNGNEIKILCEELIGNGEELHPSVSETGNKGKSTGDDGQTNNIRTEFGNNQKVDSVREGSGEVYELSQEKSSSERKSAGGSGVADSMGLRARNRNVTGAQRVLERNNVNAIELEEEIAYNEGRQAANKGTPILQRVEAMSLNNEPITVEEAKRASGYGENGAKVLADFVNNSKDKSFSQVKGDMHRAYIDGLTNKKINFNNDFQQEAYFAGKKDRTMQTIADKVSAKNAVINKESGFSAKNLPSDVTPNQVEIVNTMAEALGIKAYIAKGLDANAEINHATGEVAIDYDFEREIGTGASRQKVSIVFHAAHEMALHRVVELAPEEGRAFVYEMYKHLAKGDSSNITLADQKRSAYAEQGEEISLAKAMEEISANNILYLYNNDEAKFHKAIDRIVNGKNEKAKQGLRKYIDYLNNIIKKIWDLLSGKSAKERAKYQPELDEITRLRDMFESAFAKAVENRKTLKSNQNQTNGTDKEFSLKVAKKKGTWYNEYQTNALSWARSTERQVGDVTILNANGKYFALIEATDDGFIELVKGSYKEVQTYYERAYRKTTDEVYGNTESFRLDQGRDIWDMQPNGEGRDGSGNNQQVGSERLQGDTTGNNEHLRSSDKGKSFSLKQDKNDLDNKIKKISDLFGISDIDDYVDVQKNVLKTLQNENFFTDKNRSSKIVINKESGMSIEINRKSINETFSKGKKYEYLGKERKYFKLATIRQIDSLIQNAKVISRDNANYHTSNSSVKYTYLKAETNIDGIPVEVTIDIRQSPQNNKLWVHQVYTRKNTEVNLAGADSSKTSLMNLSTNNIIHSKSLNVKKEFSYIDKIGETEHLEKENKKQKADKGVSYSLKWHPDLTRQQVKMVEGWLQEEGSPEATRITDTANWYMGRISGQDLFVIYSNEDAKGSTILYESKGKQAKLEKDILMDLLEEIENGKSANGKSAYVNWVFSGGWMRQRNSIRHNISRLGSGQNNQNAGVLPGQPQGNPSAAFENVIRNLFKIQKRDGNKEHSLKGTVVDGEIASLVKKYGTIPKGENPARDIDVPRKTADGRKVSHTVRTILEAKATPDEALPSISELVTKGEFSYDAYTDKEAIAEAEETITKKGWEQAKADWYKAVGKGEVSKRNTALGWAIYNNAVNSGEMETALEVLGFMVKHQRSAAQALQATRILKKLSPETQLYGVQKSVSALQEELTDKYGKKAPELKISEELAEKFLTATTEDERLAAEIELYKDIGRQMPSDLLDKWNAWRYTAMLTSLRTHGRNILGNAGFAPVVLMKNLTATAIESVVHRVSGKKMVRGKALVWGCKTDKALLKAAWNDYANVADIVSNGGKYNDSAMGNKYIEEGRVIFKGFLKPVEAVRKGNSKLLELEDVWFSKPHYAYALAQYCKANNITPEQISRGKAIAPAREYAIKEAQKATYKDTNALSQMVSGWGRNGASKNGLEKAGRGVVEGALPYRKTPANILARGIEYSPAGLLKGLTYDLYKVGKGEMQATEAIDNISAGLTGTGLLALGVYLAALGLVRGNGGDDEEKKEFEELMGHQAYALELPNGQSITLNWLAPESMPFFVGVNIWEAINGSDKELNLSTILEAVSNISDPMLEQSFLQGLNDVFESVGYAKSNDTSALYAILSTAITSYLSQGIPTVFGQIERTGEANRMTTYAEKNAFLTDDMQYTLGRASAKIPFWDYQQIPYIDAWGRKEASGTALKRGLNNFLNPAYTSTIETSKMEEELLRLYEQTGEDGVFPSRADKYFTVDGVRKDLTADEYVRYATLKGEKSYKLVSDLVKSTAYKKLSDEEKVKAIEETYDYANQKAKQAISNYKPETWVSKADEFGSNVGNYISFKTEVSGTKEENGGKISKQEVVDIILDMAQNDSETWKMYLSIYDSEKEKYAYNRGIGGEDYMDFLTALDRYDKPTESGKYGTYTQAETAEAINNLKGLSREEKAILWQSVNTSWKKNPFR